MAQRTQVLRLYRRALRLAEPYIESDGVQDFMRREMMQEMKKRKVCWNAAVIYLLTDQQQKNIPEKKCSMLRRV